MIAKLKKIIDRNNTSDKVIWKSLDKLKILLWKIKKVITWVIYRISLIVFPGQANKIFQTKKFSVNPQASVEVHTLTGHKYLRMYLLAIKSLLRFYSNISVVVHSDGSLSQIDQSILKEHIKGIRIINIDEADLTLEKYFKNRPKTKKIRKEVVVAAQLLDYPLMANTKKIISMDSDIIFFKRPDELIDWIENDEAVIICNQDETEYQQAKIFLRTKYSFEKNVNIGFACFFVDIIDLDVIEGISKEIDKFDFCTYQNIFSVLIHGNKDKYKFKFFDSDKYQTRNFFSNTDPVFRHYLSTSGINISYLVDYKKVLNELLQTNE